MHRDQAKRLIIETFENPFDKDKFAEFIANLLKTYDRTKTFTYQGNYIPDAFKNHITSLERIGQYTYDDKEIDLLIVRLERGTSLECARTMQRNFIAWYLKGSRGGKLKDAALVAFVSPESEDWRFSLVKMDYRFVETPTGKIKVKEEFTPAKRWSFLVGKNEKSHTAQSRFLPLLESDKKPTLEDLEEAFNVEVVTKEFFQKYSCKIIMDTIKRDLRDFNVRFDVWYSQGKLGRSGKVEKGIEFLKNKKYIYEKEGALWFKSTGFGDDKDRVIRKSDGSYTYLAPDIAYHNEKFKRGFDRLIDIWGPDHHGYVSRLKAAIQALGFKEDAFSVIIIQLSTLFRDGRPLSMSTREGEFVTLRELINEVGRDAARFFFLMRKADSHLDFDLELAKKQSPQNPVYYVQYAHARICSILKKKGISRIKARLDLLKEKEEMELIRFLWEFPYIVQSCCYTLEPHGLSLYLQELAKIFHSFYDKHRVIGDDAELTKARLFLVNCAKIVFANGLRLLGVSAPKKM
ncbi:MAG: arginine--tRNA ligase [Candidatus Omnitrophica bacterium]|nr:arginine--tRNA ligase [Candidatus Omnitrophota bacterium]